MKIGDILKQARMEKGLTLSQISKEILIQEKYLRALEEGDYDVIPGEAYQRAYFKAYAEHLGLSEYINSLTQPHRFAPETEEKPVNDIFGGVWDAARITRVAIKLGLLILVPVLIAVMVRGAVSKRPERPEPNRVASTQPIAVLPVDAQPTWKIPDSTQPGAAGASHELKLTAKGQCWVEVQTRDRPDLLRKTMVQGETLTFTDPIGFYIFTGRPENLEIVFDGEPVPWGQGESRKILPEGAAVLPDSATQGNQSGGN